MNPYFLGPGFQNRLESETRDVHLLLCLNCTNQIVTFGRSQFHFPGIPILLGTAVPILNFHARLLSAVTPLKLV